MKNRFEKIRSQLEQQLADYRETNGSADDYELIDFLLALKYTKQQLFDNFTEEQLDYAEIILDAVIEEEYEIAKLAKECMDENITSTMQTLTKHKEHKKADIFHLKEITRMINDNNVKIIKEI